jgi:outer membrane protein
MFKTKRKMRQASTLLGLLTLMWLGANAQTLSLEQCIELARKQNAQVQAATLDAKITGSRIQEAKSAAKPQVNVSGDYHYTLQIPQQVVPASFAGGPANEFTRVQFGVPWSLGTTVSATQILYSAQLKNGLQLIEAANQASTLNIEKVEKDVAYHVASLYYNVQILERQTQFLQANAQSLNKIRATTQLLKDQALVKGSDVDRLALNVQTLGSQVQNLQLSKQQVLNTLKFLMGKPLDETLELDALEIKANETLALQSQQRTDLKLLDLQKTINEIEQRSIRDEFKPSVVAFGSYSNTGTGKSGENAFLFWIPASLVGVQVKWNVFDGFARKHKLATKQFEAEKLGVQHKTLNENIKLEALNARNNYDAQQILARDFERQIVLAEKIYGQAQLQFKNGLTSVTEVIQAENNLREVQNNLVSTLIKLKIHELDYKKAIGAL